MGKIVIVLIVSFFYINCQGREINPVAVKSSQARLRGHVAKLTGLWKRNVTNRYELNVAASYIKGQLAAMGIATRYQNFSRRGRLYKNVIGYLGPKNGRTVVIGAHYDVAGVGPGADDNASGVAGLIEVARILKSKQNKLKDRNLRVELVGYTLEEPPVFATDKMGSYIHAESLAKKGVEVEVMLSLEMIGYFTDEEDSQEYPMPGMGMFYPDKGNFIAVVSDYNSDDYADLLQNVFNETTKLPCETLTAPSIVPGVDFSDHRNYWEFDYPAIMVTDTSFYRNPHYHERTDTIHTLDFPRMNMVVEGVARFVLNL